MVKEDTILRENIKMGGEVLEKAFDHSNNYFGYKVETIESH